jgi:hypothetical protein
VLVTDILGTMGRPILASLFMYAVVFTAKNYAVFGHGGAVLHLAELVLLGVVTYTGAMLVLDREVCRDAGDVFGAFLGRRVRLFSYEPRPPREHDEVPLARR